MNIYLATSWKNEHYVQVRQFLLDNGFDVYDFRDPAGAFKWSAIDPDWESKDHLEQSAMLNTAEADRGFGRDMEALRDCDTCVMLYPCGNDAHLELGWAVGQGKYTVVYVKPGYQVGLMDKMANIFVSTDQQLLEALR